MAVFTGALYVGSAFGAVCPVAGLYLSDKTYEEDPRFDAWADNARPFLSLSSLKTSA